MAKFKRREQAIVIMRAGFQSLNGSTGAMKAVLDPYGAAQTITAGRAVRVPTEDIPDLLEAFAAALRGQYDHKYSDGTFFGYEGIDQFTLTIQAETPTPN